MAARQGLMSAATGCCCCCCWKEVGSVVEDGEKLCTMMRLTVPSPAAGAKTGGDDTAGPVLELAIRVCIIAI